MVTLIVYFRGLHMGVCHFFYFPGFQGNYFQIHKIFQKETKFDTLLCNDLKYSPVP